MLKHRILIVDDDERLLKSFKRILSSKFYVDTALNADGGLDAIAQREEYSIVISDYKMPGMNGVDFLAQVMKSCPDTVRILLTGFADLNVALDAVNDGNIFRMLQKPCAPRAMAKALMDGVRAYEMAAAKRELMEKTIHKSVGILGDLISLVKPEVYGRIARITPYVRHIAREMDPPNIWEVVTGARLSMVGFVTLPDVVIEKDLHGRSLTKREQQLFDEHPDFSATFIGKIPRMEEVARIIAYQDKRFDGTGPPRNDVKKDAIPLGARILKVCLDFDRHVSGGMSYGEALNELSSHEKWYDPDVLGYLFEALGDCPVLKEQDVYLSGLTPGMVVTEDVYAKKGETAIKLVASGQELSEMTIEYLNRYSATYEIPQPIKVLEAPFCML